MAQLSTSVRSSLNDQLTWLQGKHNAEVDLLEDLRQFARQRSAMEKQYSENLHRLVTQYSGKREPLKATDVPGFERNQNRGLIEVWKSLLEKTDELSKRRHTISELLLSQVADVAKQQKKSKEANYKRLIEVCQKMNSEILESTKELGVCKKSYSEVEKVCEEARAKYSEVDARVRKRDTKFFESMASLEKSHKKLSDRLQSCQKRAVCSRNEYLLTVESTNAHLSRYTATDLPQLMEALDGATYKVARQAYSCYAQLECDAAVLVKAEFEDLAEQANFVNREYVLEMFLQQHPSLRNANKYEFEPYGQDSVKVISRDHGAEIFLDKDARKWASKLTKDQASVVSIEKQIKGLQTVTSAYAKNPDFGTYESYTEAQQSIEQLQEEVRQITVQIIKTQAKLDALRQAGVDVNKWLQKAERSQGDKHSTSASELTPNLSHGRVSQLSLPSAFGGSQDFDVETASVNSAQGADDTMSMTSSKSDNQPKLCRALYSYSAQRADELDITEGQELEVLEWDDGDGWCKGKSAAGKEGYFPQSYVEPLSRPSSPVPSNPSTVVAQSGSSSGGAQVACSHQMSVTSTTSTLTAASTAPSQSLSLPNGNQGGGDTLLKAVYDYDAQYEEELSFPEGAVIKLLRTDENGVDDGWWEGSYLGRVGVFPSVVVEVMSNGTTSPDMNSTIMPPTESPPPPMESPPPLPPACLPISSSSPHGEASNLGPSPRDDNVWSATPINPPTAGGSRKTPAVKLNAPSPVDAKRGILFSDSFDEYDGDESFV